MRWLLYRTLELIYNVGGGCGSYLGLQKRADRSHGRTATLVYGLIGSRHVCVSPLSLYDSVIASVIRIVPNFICRLNGLTGWLTENGSNYYHLKSLGQAHEVESCASDITV